MKKHKQLQLQMNQCIDYPQINTVEPLTYTHTLSIVTC